VYNYRTVCLEASVYNYQTTLHDIPADGRYQYIPNLSLKGKVTFDVLALDLDKLFSCSPTFETRTATQIL
jgi:hypothetical protein